MFDPCFSFFSPDDRFTMPPSRTVPFRFALPLPPTFIVGRTWSSGIVWRSSSMAMSSSSSSSPSSSSSKSLAAFDAAGVCMSWGSMLGESAEVAENEPEPDDSGLLICVSCEA
ncbi:hypothetical protein GSI_12366 [Ganoderma sinense ZZ0214-1]|uniref:Uncharacterized protein n=1 Tax=Ganoderma sinense ZZ0214-1 TaxID=1077348 RepID=A0A2G8RW47_9APHY|nr:hypothetical protein GSI_12366 [Ganoderma sinense ZZ0214-1]